MKNAEAQFWSRGVLSMSVIGYGSAGVLEHGCRGSLGVVMYG